ncbi:MAG: penicillin-binding protein 2 [Bacteroidetes bacterium]|nr:MAG: penicillin-binding protein 2 [Bacteroidota bacterium]
MNNEGLRKYIVAGFVLLLVFTYIGRLFYIQVVDDSYKLSSRNQAFYFKTDYPPRGFIYDRKGKLLVYNQIAYDLLVTPKMVKSLDTNDMCKQLGMDRDVFVKRLKKLREEAFMKRDPRPLIFEKQLLPEVYARLQEHMYKYRGFEVQTRTVRKYPTNIAAHLLGYVGEVDKKVTEKNPYYRDGDYIGISGVEKGYEEVLRGRKGVSILMRDVHGNIKGKFKDGIYDTAAIPGKYLTSSLDADLQLYGEQLMQNKIGGIVAIEPGTGEILALITSPTYDPNLLVGRERTKNYVVLLQDTIGRPLFNRALMAYYPPGSTFKLLNALIGQQEGVLTPSTLYPCARGYPPMGGKPKCHPHASPTNLEGSIATSCNSYYSYVFRSIVENRRKYKRSVDGYTAWRKYVQSFGVGVKLDSDLPYVLKGNVPSVEYYDKLHGKGAWMASNIISLGIGQAELGITPLQMANITSTIANKGWYYTPHIIKSIGDEKEIDAKWKVKHYTMVTDTQYFNNVIEGMYKVVEAGTARIAQIPGIEVCGKTGTAQNPHGDDHSVFVCFAPKDNPKIAIAILVENSGYGSRWAAPIASLMVEKYLTGKITRPELEKRMLEGNLISKSTDPKAKKEEPEQGE